MLLYLLCMPRSTRGLALVSDCYLPKPHLLHVRHHTIHPTDAVLHSARRRYERFLKIMMLSVVKKTKAPVKFWLLNNFLSPQFKTAIPKMAAHYGFEYEFVTYKWPSWLHQQTEKQRIIWGYKVHMCLAFSVSNRSLSVCGGC